MSKKGKSKKKVTQRCKEVVDSIIVLAVVASIFLVAFIHFDQESEKNTYTKSGAIYGVERIMGSGKRRWIMFSMNGEEFYYTLKGETRSKNKNILSEFLEAEKEKQNVTLTITKEPELSHLLSTANKEAVVAVSSDDGISIPIDMHNRNERFMQIFWIIIGGGIFVVFILHKVIFNVILK